MQREQQQKKRLCFGVYVCVCVVPLTDTSTTQRFLTQENSSVFRHAQRVSRQIFLFEQQQQKKKKP